jgi:hypothetical protein
MSEEIDVLLKIGSKFYEGKLHPQRSDQHPPNSIAKAPIFPEPYAEMLTVSDEGDAWTVRPREFLKPNDFKEIASIIKQYGGSYVSAGKFSHFRVPK